MSTSPLTQRGLTQCRGCGELSLVSVLDLGDQPLANDLATDPGLTEPGFPLHLHICSVCGLGQVGEYVLPERIFSDYPYLSSMSSSWLAHARQYAGAMRDELALEPTDLVVEVASNDGYLLTIFQETGQRVLGIEPAANVAAIATSAGVTTVCDFFGQRLARQVLADFGHPRLIVANNVMAHVPDLDDFVTGLGLLAGEATIITIENPTLLNLLLETQFDTIYHEHFSYLSAHSVREVAVRHGLELIKVEALPTHGGSNRYWLALEGTHAVDSSVAEALGHERDHGLMAPQMWEAFAMSSQAAISGLRSWLDDRRRAGVGVVAVGASAKGNTLMNAAGVCPDDILAVTDASPEKQGRFLPGSHIPIVAPDALAYLPAGDALITPWNIADELAATVSAAAPDLGVWVAIPEMRKLR